MKETELYRPVEEYLLRQGYEVSAEVRHCDIAAIKDDELVIVELKSAANLTLLIQATDRQFVADAVYVAVPEPDRKNSHFRGIERILKQLGLGLITVRFGPLGPAAAKRFGPAPRVGPAHGKKRAAVIREIAGRSENVNIGGTGGTTIMTAYRESALFIACCLDQLGPCSTRELRALGGGDKTASILYKNYYGWFERVSKGVYRLSSGGIAAIRHYPDFRNRAQARLADASCHPPSPET